LKQFATQAFETTRLDSFFQQVLLQQLRDLGG
jgi:hypothetical protein